MEFSQSRLKPVARVSTASVVARQLLDELQREHFTSGTRLPPERTMADTLGVGRSTLREAMAALGLLGIIEVRPGSGSYLKADSSELLPRAIQWGLSLGQPDAGDLVEVRENLELLAATLAALRATPKDADRLRVHLDHMRESGQDVEQFVEADLAFHFETARIAGNVVLESILQSIRSLLHTWFEKTLQVEGTMTATLAEHERVYEAIKDGDARAAETAMRVLMENADTRLRRLE